VNAEDGRREPWRRGRGGEGRSHSFFSKITIAIASSSSSLSVPQAQDFIFHGI
jgi:hypothetical protein